MTAPASQARFHVLAELSSPTNIQREIKDLEELIGFHRDKMVEAMLNKAALELVLMAQAFREQVKPLMRDEKKETPSE